MPRCERGWSRPISHKDGTAPFGTDDPHRRSSSKIEEHPLTEAVTLAAGVDDLQHSCRAGKLRDLIR
jgi:hypothetical protein